MRPSAPATLEPLKAPPALDPTLTSAGPKQTWTSGHIWWRAAAAARFSSQPCSMSHCAHFCGETLS